MKVAAFSTHHQLLLTANNPNHHKWCALKSKILISQGIQARLCPSATGMHVCAVCKHCRLHTQFQSCVREYPLNMNRNRHDAEDNPNLPAYYFGTTALHA
jgi:hypothetical protein